MKATRFYNLLLSLLGLQLTSCNVTEEEYGCPYANFNVQGLVVSEKGELLENAKISVDLENTYEKNRNKKKTMATATTIISKQMSQQTVMVISPSTNLRPTAD